MRETSIRVLGSGNAFNQDGRGSPSVQVEPAVGGAFLIDAGPTVLASLNRFGVDASSIDRLFFTHLHGDHTAGWPFFLLHQAYVAERQRPLWVVGPPGTRDTLERLTACCYGELAAGTSFHVEFQELAVQQARGIPLEDGLTLDVLPMQHHPTSIGYRFRVSADGRETVLAVSGDTGWGAQLEALADGADLLLLECSSIERQWPAHLSLAEVRERLDRLRAQRIVLVHLTDAVAERLAVDPLQRVVAAYDGLTLQVDSAPC